MINTILLVTGTVCLILGLYPFIMQWLRNWRENIIVTKSMTNIDGEIDWLLKYHD